MKTFTAAPRTIAKKVRSTCALVAFCLAAITPAHPLHATTEKKKATAKSQAGATQKGKLVTQAPSLICQGDLEFFAMNPKQGNSKINQIGFNGSFTPDNLVSLKFGVFADKPWLEVWPWDGIAMKRYSDPAIPGAVLKYSSTETTFSVALFQKSKPFNPALSCEVRY